MDYLVCSTGKTSATNLLTRVIKVDRSNIAWTDVKSIHKISTVAQAGGSSYHRGLKSKQTLCRVQGYGSVNLVDMIVLIELLFN